MPIEAETIEEYMAALPENRKEAVERLHQVIVEQLPAGFEVGILGAMINYYVPLAAYPDGYHCTPGEPLAIPCLGITKGTHRPLPHGNLYGPRIE